MLLKVDGVKVGADGRAALVPGVRVDLRFIEQRRQVGDRIELEFVRAGKRFRKRLQLQAPKWTVPLGTHKGEAPYRCTD